MKSQPTQPPGKKLLFGGDDTMTQICGIVWAGTGFLAWGPARSFWEPESTRMPAAFCVLLFMSVVAGAFAWWNIDKDYPGWMWILLALGFYGAALIADEYDDYLSRFFYHLSLTSSAIFGSFGFADFRKSIRERDFLWAGVFIGWVLLSVILLTGISLHFKGLTFVVNAVIPAFLMIASISVVLWLMFAKKYIEGAVLSALTIITSGSWFFRSSKDFVVIVGGLVVFCLLCVGILIALGAGFGKLKKRWDEQESDDPEGIRPYVNRE